MLVFTRILFGKDFVIMEDNLLAKVHSFESFGAVDGPGIRYIIFMQGCHLQCKYCQNRDTWNVNEGTLYSVSDLMKKILKYKNYFIASGGGVTISGGEPLLQSKFLIQLFKELKKENITIAVDTSGSVALTDTIKEVISLADLFLLDIKCINDNICQDLTGVSNKRELEFAKYLSDNNKDIWIRQVLVPGITDHEDDLLKLKEFLQTLKTVKKVDILPYHDLGKFKWTNLGLQYPLEGVRTANNDDVARAKKILGLI